jgi:glyoxylase-like metal-dependent hydrolase (beta-lactamase superfamily II)
VQFIAHPLTRQDIVNHAFASNAFVVDLIESDIARIGGYLETGVGRDGTPLTPEARARAQLAYDKRREMLADRRSFVAVPPTIDVAEERTLRDGGREIQVRFLGRGNTRGDLVVYLPKEGILATGDLVVAPIPYATNVYVKDWIATFDRLMAIPATTILPGHGPVMRDWSYVRTVKGALEQTLAAVADAKKAGLTLAQTVERVQLPELRDSFVAGVETRRAGYEAFFRTSLVRNAWEELDAGVMKEFAATPLERAGDGLYRWGGATAIVNEKDVVLVNAPRSAAAARAMVRALRELTDKAVRHVVIPDWKAADAAAIAVLREVYAQADVVSSAESGPTITVRDVMTLHRGAREIRISRGPDGRLTVRLPNEQVEITR